MTSPSSPSVAVTSVTATPAATARAQGDGHGERLVVGVRVHGHEPTGHARRVEHPRRPPGTIDPTGRGQRRLCHAGAMGFLDSGRAMADRFEFRPRTGLAACGVWVLLAAIWLLLDMRTGLAAAARDLPVIGAISTIVYALFWRPKVVVGRDEVLLRNVFRDVSVPYPDLRRVHTQYVLALETHSGRRFQAWAAPAGGAGVRPG